MPEPLTAPAAHLVTVKCPEEGGGVLVGHSLCNAPDVFVPNRTNTDAVLAIDIIQAVTNHKCPPGQGDDPSNWVKP